MRLALSALTALAILAAIGSEATAAQVSGRVVMATAARDADTWSEWGTITLRPASGPWVTVWVKASVPADAARRAFEAASASSGFEVRFGGVTQFPNPGWEYNYTCTSLAMYMTKTTNVARSTFSNVTTGPNWSSIADLSGEVKAVYLFNDQASFWFADIGQLSGNLIQFANQVLVPLRPQYANYEHYERLFSAALSGIGLQSTLTFRRILFVSGGSYRIYTSQDDTSVTAYRPGN